MPKGSRQPSSPIQLVSGQQTEKRRQYRQPQMIQAGPMDRPVVGKSAEDKKKKKKKSLKIGKKK